MFGKQEQSIVGNLLPEKEPTDDMGRAQMIVGRIRFFRSLGKTLMDKSPKEVAEYEEELKASKERYQELMEQLKTKKAQSTR